MKKINLTDVLSKNDKLKNKLENLNNIINHYVNKIDKLQEKVNRDKKIKEKLRYRYSQKLGIKKQLHNCLKNTSELQKDIDSLNVRIIILKEKLKSREIKLKYNFVYITKYLECSKNIIELLYENSDLSSQEIGNELDKSRNFISEVCSYLKRKNILVKLKERNGKKGRPKTQWRLNYERLK